MGFFYDRRENQSEVVVTFKYQAVFYLVLIAAILMSTFAERLQNYVLVAFGVFTVAWVVGRLKVNGELKKAMKSGKVEVSGGKFSFKNPLTFRIKK